MHALVLMSIVALPRCRYTGAYGIRSNFQGNDFGSILIDRGDRSAFQGDGHPSMAAAEVAFGSPQLYELTRLGLEITDCYTPLKSGKQMCRFPNGTVAMPQGSYPVYCMLSTLFRLGTVQKPVPHGCGLSFGSDLSLHDAFVTRDDVGDRLSLGEW